MHKQKHSSDRRSAFTLIEIMVAALITIVMIGLVIQITGEVLKVWNRSVGKLSANAEARIAMELLTSDLETALLVNNGQQWMRIESESNVGDPIVGQTVGLKLFAPALDRSEGPGNVCAIAYRLAFAPAYTNANIETFVLFRDLESPVNTFKDLLGSTDDGPQQDLLTPGFWTEDSIKNTNNYLAGNIVDFKIYIIGVDDATSKEIVLNASGDVNGFAEYDSDFDGTIDLNYIYGGTDANVEDPLFAEISLTVVSDEGLEILALFADPEISGAGTGFTDTDEVLLRHAEVFKRRIYLQADPL